MSTPADVMTIGSKLVELCRQGRVLEAVDTLYSPSIVSVEATDSPPAPDMPAMPRRMEGIEAIRGKNQWWVENNEVHHAELVGPFPLDDRFIVLMRYDFTPKAGPMAGQRMQMQEAALYTVANGRIVKEEFFYTME